jgi:zinc transport system substrate-binding protein
MPSLMRMVVVAVLVLVWAPLHAASTLRVVASIAPVHSLAAGVMRGVGTPKLIVRGYGSPHTYQMRPSDAASLQAADLILWIGEPLETFLQKPLRTLPAQARVVALIVETPGLELLPIRAATNRDTSDGHDVSRSTTPDYDIRSSATVDPHIWLDPRNARRLVAQIARELSTLDPENGIRYRANAAALDGSLDELDQELGRQLTPVRDIPFVVFHDAFQYFERRYNLRALGAVETSPERLPGARRLQELRQQIVRHGARCIFHEPQFEPPLIKVIAQGTGARLAILDPLGMQLQSGPEAYLEMMRANARALVECLTQ